MSGFIQFGVGHGLSSAPQFIIQKRTSGGTSDWYAITTAIDGSVDYIKFNDVAVKVDMSGTYANFTLGSNSFSDWWGAGDNIINYCFHSVNGYSRMSTYTGTSGSKRVYNTDDGTSTGSGGFTPSFVIIRNIFTAGAWMIYDSARSSDPLNKTLMVNYTSAEQTQSSATMNLHSDGFTINGNIGASNANGNTYFYMAFK